MKNNQKSLSSIEWKIDETDIEVLEPPKSYVGFVYKIVFDDGKMYIGKKNFYSRRKRNFGKKELAKITDKRLKKYEYVVKESNWRTYTSSNKTVNERIKNGDKYSKYIMAYGLNSKHLTYIEESYLVHKDVLWYKYYYNDNIAGRFYTKDVQEWERIRKLV